MDNKRSNTLLLTHRIRSVMDIFTGIFLGIYFYQLFDYNIIPVALFYIVLYLAHIVIYFLIYAAISNKNIMHFFRFSFFLLFMVCILFVILQKDIVHYIYPFALFYALASSMYWSTYQLIIFENNTGSNFKSYFSLDHMIGNIFSFIFPVLFGVLIDTSSYHIVFMILAFTTAGALILSFFIPLMKTDCSIFDLRLFFKKLKNSSLFHIVCGQSVCQGLTNSGGLKLLTTLIIFKNLPSISFSGILNSVIGLSTILIVLYNKKKINSKNFLKYALPISVGVLLISIPLSFTTKVYLFVIYSFVIAATDIVISLNADFLLFKVQTKIAKKEFRDEYLYIREVFLNIGRAIGLGFIVLFAALIPNQLNLLFIFLSSFYIVRSLLLNKLYK